MVLCEMTPDRTVGPSIFCDSMITERYLTILQDTIWPVVNTWGKIEDLMLMQDGARPHFVIVVCEWLSEHCPM